MSFNTPPAPPTTLQVVGSVYEKVADARERLLTTTEHDEDTRLLIEEAARALQRAQSHLESVVVRLTRK